MLKLLYEQESLYLKYITTFALYLYYQLNLSTNQLVKILSKWTTDLSQKPVTPINLVNKVFRIKILRTFFLH